MNAKYINPFLTSSVHVIEATMQIKPSVGQVLLKSIEGHEDFLFLKIGIVGQFSGEIVFCFPQDVAMKIVSAMMGGYPIEQFDDMCRSAISELGNMISGNASTMLYNDGVVIDITPPNIISFTDQMAAKKALTIPLQLTNIGAFDIYMIA